MEEGHHFTRQNSKLGQVRSNNNNDNNTQEKSGWFYMERDCVVACGDTTNLSHTSSIQTIIDDVLPPHY